MYFCLLLKIRVKILIKINTARNFLIMLKKAAADALKNSTKRVIQETAEATDDLIGNEIASVVLRQ